MTHHTSPHFSQDFVARRRRRARGYKARDEGSRRHTREYVEEPEEAQRRRHAWIHRRSGKPVRNAGWLLQIKVLQGDDWSAIQSDAIDLGTVLNQEL
jgi:hypothetical protein